MISKPVALGLFAIACLSATAGGAYFAARQDGTPQAMAVEPAAQQVASARQGVAETEAIVEPTAAIAPVKPAASERGARAARVEPAAYVSKDGKAQRDSRTAATRTPAAAAPPARDQQPTIAPEPAPAVEDRQRPLERLAMSRRLQHLWARPHSSRLLLSRRPPRPSPRSSRS